MTIARDPASASSFGPRRCPWITATLGCWPAVAVVIATLAGSASAARDQVARDKAAIASLRGQVSALGRVPWILVPGWCGSVRCLID